MFGIRIDHADRNLELFARRYGALTSTKLRGPFARAINRTTAMVQTQAVRVLAKQISIPQRIVRGALSKKQASTHASGSLQGEVVAKGAPLTLKLFRPRQFGYGVRAFIKGSAQRFPSAFMGPRPGTIAPALRGNVFRRTSSSRLPIVMLHGPAIPPEMIIGESERAFRSLVATVLPKRVAHEVGRLLP